MKAKFLLINLTKLIGVIMRKVEKLLLVFDELSKYTNENYSKAELLNASENIIKFSQKEELSNTIRSYFENPNYYSLEIDKAFDQIPFKILKKERRDYFSAEEQSIDQDYLEFKKINLGTI